MYAYRITMSIYSIIIRQTIPLQLMYFVLWQRPAIISRNFGVPVTTDYAGQLRSTAFGTGINQMRLFDTRRTTTYAHCQLNVHTSFNY